MKRLAVLRHAKSSWADPGMADFDRPLNERGRKAARLIGREMTARKMRFDCVLASPAERVRETIRGVQEEYRLEPAVRFEQRIYEAGARTVVDLVKGLPDDCESVLLVGHNPGLHELVLDLADRDEHGFRDRIRGKFPTAALASVELPVKTWRNLQAGTGKIVELILPRELG
jgi:phosphohistidine phosphatase